MCRNRKSGKQDIPELQLQSGTALRAYLAKLRLDCHTSLADGFLPALAEAVPQTPLQARASELPRPTVALRVACRPKGGRSFFGAFAPLFLSLAINTRIRSKRSFFCKNH